MRPPAGVVAGGRLLHHTREPDVRLSAAEPELAGLFRPGNAAAAQRGCLHLAGGADDSAQCAAADLAGPLLCLGGVDGRLYHAGRVVSYVFPAQLFRRAVAAAPAARHGPADDGRAFYPAPDAAVHATALQRPHLHHLAAGWHHAVRDAGLYCPAGVQRAPDVRARLAVRPLPARLLRPQPAVASAGGARARPRTGAGSAG